MLESFDVYRERLRAILPYALFPETIKLHSWIINFVNPLEAVPKCSFQSAVLQALQYIEHSIPKPHNTYFLSSTPGIHSRVNHILDLKSSKFNKIEIIPNIFSDYNCMKLDIYNMRKTKKKKKKELTSKQ